MIEMFIADVGCDPKTKQPFVLLQDRDQQRVLPIRLGPGEPEVIGVAVMETMGNAPAENLLIKTFNEMGYSVVSVSLRQDDANRCSGVVHLAPRTVARQFGFVDMHINCAAYDAIAVSARVRQAVMVPESLLACGGLPADPAKYKADTENFHNFVSQLKATDFRSANSQA
jgi:bifunctional DNase/RNase